MPASSPPPSFKPPTSSAHDAGARPRPSWTERHQSILEAIRHSGEIRVTDVAAALDVSEMTVRRDLDYLAQRGLLARVHGGAVIRDDRTGSEPDFATKRERQMPEKIAIARTAAELVPSGAAIGITGGTTTFEIAHHLDRVRDITVVTNSLAVAEALNTAARSDVVVVLTGGTRTRSNALVGPVAVNTLHSFHLDMVIMGVHGMDELRGFTSPNLLEAETNRAFLGATQQLVVVADHSKWSTSGLTTIAPLDAADVLITDTGLSEAAKATLSANISTLITADPADLSPPH